MPGASYELVVLRLLAWRHFERHSALLDTPVCGLLFLFQEIVCQVMSTVVVTLQEE
jgi:hypothetical protein